MTPRPNISVIKHQNLAARRHLPKGKDLVGRPRGWHLKFRNRSIVNAILSHAQEHTIYDGWKDIQVYEWKPPPLQEDMQEISPKDSGGVQGIDDLRSEDSRESLIVTDSMLRVENCPGTLSSHDLMLMMSRYDLSPTGRSVQEWKGMTEDGNKKAPLMYVVHFADPSWARAALRDLQSTEFDGKVLRFAQYPRQIRWDFGQDSSSEENREEAV